MFLHEYLDDTRSIRQGNFLVKYNMYTVNITRQVLIKCVGLVASNTLLPVGIICQTITNIVYLQKAYKLIAIAIRLLFSVKNSYTFVEINKQLHRDLAIFIKCF